MTMLRELRERLVTGLRASGALHDERVAAALTAVPRHEFLPGVELDRAYADDAVVTKLDADGRPVSSSSQPAIMALMLEQLGVQPGHRVLEIGAGTGFNAALLAHLAGGSGEVTTVDLDAEVAAAAREHLEHSGFGRVSVACADGGRGWPPDAPYDRIIATVGAWDIAPAWVDQLGPGGRLVLPLSLRPGMQYSVAFERAADHLESVSICPCGFMRLRGAFAGPETLIPLGRGTGMLAEVGVRPQDADPLPALLDQPGEDLPAGIRVTPGDLWAGLGLWLAACEPAVGRLSSFSRAPAGPRPAALVPPGEAGTSMLTSAHGCAALVRAAADSPVLVCCPAPAGPAPVGPAEPFELAARPFGRDGPALAARLVALARDWDAAGRPSPAELRISAYPFLGKIPGTAEAAIIGKPHTTLVLAWQRPAPEPVSR
jgi:protein-L-isoaspartate(D-aspartate) O-methyltransferase